MILISGFVLNFWERLSTPIILLVGISGVHCGRKLVPQAAIDGVVPLRSAQNDGAHPALRFSTNTKS